MESLPSTPVITISQKHWEFAWSTSRQRPSSPFLLGLLQGFDGGGRLMHRNSGERHFASCATRDPFIAMDPSIPGALHHILVCLFTIVVFPLFFPLFHHASSSLSQTLWLYFGWELSLFEFGNGALFILCLHYVLRQCTRVSGVLFLCAYLYGATCQSTQTLSLCSGWELSPFWNCEMVHWWCYAALRASSMYLYMWSYFPVCFPHFFTCLHYASLSIANAMPLFWLGIVAIWILERCIFHLILCLPCVDNVPEPLHRTMYLYLHLWSQLRAVILTLGRHLNFVKGALFVHWQWICAAALDRSPYAPVVENFFHP